MAIETTLENYETYDRTLFGFWTYLMTDCLLFATFFATYGVLHHNINGGPSAKEIFSLPYAFSETLILLLSSFISGLGLLSAYKRSKNQVLIFLSLTFLLGFAFLAMEGHEFSNLIQEGHTPRKSAFLSSYFTLVGTHGLHILSGLIWILVLGFQIVFQGITINTFRRLSCLTLFWHFLDVIWIFIFTIVYLMGAA
ncbi:cytochrome o ubiquinol oxidase subunit III [Criblamydia sequanensis]|uniref:Cytochrome bo(3) ubiquinol oxidase subunit 3 n=1 Tax=Candidatus Criblamydia sequanensis CRIB-18 TaxID=1437425 RepID=A0A090E438_9BACT|nr:cytochrome o ubiquinol oxidase subunit III [Criblamydia sequanensis]CDR35239.1 Cytochrome o ubiquinol oxidase, subunit III [Criblamydia sequanensis CRIB-18]